MNTATIELIGVVNKKHDMRYSAGNATAMLTIGVSTSQKRRGTSEYDKCYFDVKVLGKTAEMVNEHFEEGNPIIVRGEFDLGANHDTNGVRMWTGQDGVAHGTIQVLATEIIFPPKGFAASGQQRGSSVKPTEDEPDWTNEPEDLPF